MSYRPPFKIGGKICELGGGEKPIIRPNVDIRPGETVDVLADLEQPFLLLTESYDGVYSKSLIEHISWRKVKQFVSEIYRILKPGGCAVIITPNLKTLTKMVASKECWDGSESQLIFAGHNHLGITSEGNWHKSGLCPEYAVRIFREAGFDEVKILEYPPSVCCGGEFGATEMIIEAHKPKNRWRC